MHSLCSLARWPTTALRPAVATPSLRHHVNGGAQRQAKAQRPVHVACHVLFVNTVVLSEIADEMGPLHLGQTELAAVLGVSQAAVSQWASGRRTPDEATMRLLQQALDARDAPAVVIGSDARGDLRPVACPRLRRPVDGVPSHRLRASPGRRRRQDGHAARPRDARPGLS